MKIYLDVCCLNRPFDDPTQLRVATEAVAVERLLALVDAGRVEYFSSEMARIEIDRITDLRRRRKVTALLPASSHILKLTEQILTRATSLESIGFTPADAVHLTAARVLEVDVFVTTDDRLIRKTRRNVKRVKVRVLGPIELVTEIENAHDD